MTIYSVSNRNIIVKYTLIVLRFAYKYPHKKKEKKEKKFGMLLGVINEILTRHQRVLCIYQEKEKEKEMKPILLGLNAYDR